MPKASQPSQEQRRRRSHFVDEKRFLVDEVANSRDTRVIALYPSDVPAVMQSENPTSVMVLAAVASDGKVMPPNLF